MKWLWLAALVILAGCQPERRDAPRRPVMPDAEGKRLLVVDTAGKPLGKLRIRKHNVRVYDGQMSPIGTVRADAQNLVCQPVSGAPMAFEAKNEAREFGQMLRVEPMEKGWAVFAQNAVLLGYIEYTNAWTFRKTYSDRELWRVEKNRVMAGQMAVCEAQSLTERPAFTLALCLSDLPVEARAMLGAWMETVQPKGA